MYKLKCQLIVLLLNWGYSNEINIAHWIQGQLQPWVACPIVEKGQLPHLGLRTISIDVIGPVPDFIKMNHWCKIS